MAGNKYSQKMLQLMLEETKSKLDILSTEIDNNYDNIDNDTNNLIAYIYNQLIRTVK